MVDARQVGEGMNGLMGVTMDEYHWTPEDHAEDKVRRKSADQRLEAWARWQRASGVHIGFPTQSPIVSVMAPGDEEQQAGARHLAVEATDEEALQVDRILARWKAFRRRYWKIIRVEYMTFGTGEKKAKRCGFRSRSDYIR